MPKTRKKSPTARVMDELRRLGYEPTVVEQHIPKTFIKRDAWNWCDIIAINGVNILGVQVTTGDNHSKRRAKILAEPRAEKWLQSGGLIEVWSVARKGSKQDKAGGVVRKEPITLEMFP
jgi:hypothetical protein